MREVLITAPGSEPVTTAQCKAQVKVDHSDDDALIDRKAKAARMLVEHYLNRALVSQTWKKQLDAFPAVIRPARAPLISVGSIQYVDTAGDTQTLAASKYQVDSDAEPARIKPAYGETWPDTRAQFNAVTVTYTAGYSGEGASPEDPANEVPTDIKEAILLVFTDLYVNREIAVLGLEYHFSDTVRALLSGHEVHPVIP